MLSSQRVREAIISIFAVLRNFIAMYKFRQIPRGWRRRRDYQSKFQTLCMWSFCAVGMVLLTYTILEYIPPLLLLRAFIHIIWENSLISLADGAVFGMWLAYGVFFYIVFIRLRSSWAAPFFETHAFDHLYDQCHTLSPAQRNRYRLSSLALSRPDLLFYTFLGSTMVIRVRMREEPPQVPGLLELPGVQLSSEQDVLLSEEPITYPEMREGEAPILSNQEEVSSAHLLITNDQTAPQEATSQEKIDTLEEEQEAIVSWQYIREMFALQIVIGQTVSFFLIETINPIEEMRKKKIEIFIKNSIYVAIIVYLATQEKGSWVLRDRLLTEVYGEVTDEIKKKFPDDIRRIRDSINGQIKSAFPDLPPLQKKKTQEADKEEGFNPFENNVVGKINSYWRLNAQCRVIGYQELTRWYQRIRETLTLKRKSSLVAEYTIEEFQELKEQLIGRYSKKYLQKQGQEEGYRGGYLIHYFSEDAFGSWAREFFKECRTKYIYVLSYIASCEEKLFAQTQQGEWVRSAAELYKECAYAATCDPIDIGLGEESLRKSIACYMQIQDDPTRLAQDICDTYKKRFERLMSEWIPEQKTREVLMEHWLELE